MANISLGYWCLVDGSAIHIKQAHDLSQNDSILPFGDGSEWGIDSSQAIKIGEWLGKPCYWFNVSELEQPVEMTELRYLMAADYELFLLVTRAVQFGHMLSMIRFCPQCGGRTHLNRADIAMQCKDCRTLHYPRIFPCIIVAIRRDNQILLANHARHQNDLYTVIAGFVEVGETLEQCVAREIKEETGIEVTNIRYFDSQPWGFPSSLMIGFLADYQSGEICVDKHELTDANWFSVDQLPQVPKSGSIARALIEHTVKQIQELNQ